MRTFMHFCGRENCTAVLKNNLSALREIEYVHVVRPSNCTVKCTLEKIPYPDTQTNIYENVNDSII